MMTNVRHLACLAVAMAALAPACGDDSSSSSTPAGVGGSVADAASEQTPEAAAGAAGTDAEAESGTDALVGDGEAGVTCGRVPGAADGDRVVVVSHPYDSSGQKAEVWEVMKLTAAGALSATGDMFTMGRSYSGNVAFTPDGEIGIAVHDEDGTLGVFRITSEGKAEVIAAKFKGAFYADRVTMHPSGDRAYVVDGNTANNGGGIYSVRIGCDGALVEEGLVVAARSPHELVAIPGKAGTFAVAAWDVLGSATTEDVHLLKLEPSPTRIASGDSFPDDEQIVSSGAATRDGKYVLIGDNGEFSGIPNRIAVLEVGESTLTHRQMIPDLNDPYSLVASPLGDVVLMVSGYGNGFKLFKYDPTNATAPFAALPDMTYNGVKPQLPGGAVMIERGQLEGRVLVVENEGVRMVQFKAGGADDLGRTPASGTSYEGMTGVVGVQP